jgi:hypothetical protein
VTYGAAYYFYMIDEEGGNPQPGYQAKYLENRFYMKRDWLTQVPEEYEQHAYAGMVPFDLNSVDTTALDMGVFQL